VVGGEILLDLASKGGGAFWTAPELLFKSKKLIPAIQQLLIGE